MERHDAARAPLSCFEGARRRMQISVRGWPRTHSIHINCKRVCKTKTFQKCTLVLCFSTGEKRMVVCTANIVHFYIYYIAYCHLAQLVGLSHAERWVFVFFPFFKFLSLVSFLGLGLGHPSFVSSFSVLRGCPSR